MHFCTYITWVLCIQWLCWSLPFWNSFCLAFSGPPLSGFSCTSLILCNFLPGTSFFPTSFRVILPGLCSSSQFILVIASILMSLTPTYILLASEFMSLVQNTIQYQISIQSYLMSSSLGEPTSIHGTFVDCWPLHTLSPIYSPILHYTRILVEQISSYQYFSAPIVVRCDRFG